MVGWAGPVHDRCCCLRRPEKGREKGGDCGRDRSLVIARRNWWGAETTVGTAGKATRKGERGGGVCTLGTASPTVETTGSVVRAQCSDHGGGGGGSTPALDRGTQDLCTTLVVLASS